MGDMADMINEGGELEDTFDGRGFDTRDYVLSGAWLKDLEEAPPIGDGSTEISCSMRFPNAPVIRAAFAVGERYGLIDDEGTLVLPPKDHPFWAALNEELDDV